MIELKEPVKAEKSEQYLVVLTDANGVQHFWLPDGTYDGYGRPHTEGHSSEVTDDTGKTIMAHDSGS